MTDEQTFIEVNRFFEDEDDLEVVEAVESVDSIDAYPSPHNGNVAAVNVQQEDYYLTIELSEDVIERAHAQLQDAPESAEE